MTNKKSTLFITILTSLVVFILTFSQFGKFRRFLIPRIDNFPYQTRFISSEIKSALLFSTVVGLTPIFLYLTWKFGRIEKTKTRIYSGLIVFVFMAISVVLRQYSIKSTYSRLTNLKTQTGETLPISLAMDNLNFENYLIGGLILGCIVSYLFLKGK